MHQTATLQGLGEFIETFDGETAWSVNPIKPAIKEGTGSPRPAGSPTFTPCCTTPTTTPRAPSWARSTLRHSCWQVDAVTSDGQTRSFFFNRDNGYLRAEKLEFISEMGTLSTVISHLAYERFQGFPVATRQVTYLGDIEIVVTTADVRYNVHEADLPDFSPPAAVQALMDELNALPE